MHTLHDDIENASKREAAQTTALALSLVQRFEGFKADPYRCPSGHWTIGYGQTLGHGWPVSGLSAPVAELEARAELEKPFSGLQAQQGTRGTGAMSNAAFSELPVGHGVAIKHSFHSIPNFERLEKTVVTGCRQNWLEERDRWAHSAFTGCLQPLKRESVLVPLSPPLSPKTYYA
ncbi:lysozyme [Formicincola oecophyllae]|uniref:Lysozyme n=1 Tax=Formicincola oecophyllae TaxID=2558361 RepID=A0A4Y6U8S9_9PROT|nr:lysozyme [Formicincola oecophyllae]QDH12857.1 lysozyme [Formicincola oecophyllae]